MSHQFHQIVPEEREVVVVAVCKSWINLLVSLYSFSVYLVIWVVWVYSVQCGFFFFCCCSKPLMGPCWSSVAGDCIMATWEWQSLLQQLCIKALSPNESMKGDTVWMIWYYSNIKIVLFYGGVSDTWLHFGYQLAQLGKQQTENELASDCVIISQCRELKEQAAGNLAFQEFWQASCFAKFLKSNICQGTFSSNKEYQKLKSGSENAGSLMDRSQWREASQLIRKFPLMIWNSRL